MVPEGSARRYLTDGTGGAIHGLALPPTEQQGNPLSSDGGAVQGTPACCPPCGGHGGETAAQARHALWSLPANGTTHGDGEDADQAADFDARSLRCWWTTPTLRNLQRRASLRPVSMYGWARRAAVGEATAGAQVGVVASGQKSAGVMQPGRGNARHAVGAGQQPVCGAGRKGR